jgi:hypothetical protein
MVAKMVEAVANARTNGANFTIENELAPLASCMIYNRTRYNP